MDNLEQGIQGKGDNKDNEKLIVERYTNGDSIIKIAKSIYRPVEEIKQILIDNKVKLDH